MEQHLSGQHLSHSKAQRLIPVQMPPKAKPDASTVFKKSLEALHKVGQLVAGHKVLLPSRQATCGALGCCDARALQRVQHTVTAPTVVFLMITISCHPFEHLKAGSQASSQFGH